MPGKSQKIKQNKLHRKLELLIAKLQQKTMIALRMHSVNSLIVY